jgi:2,4-dienoyl-CoA reductase (NADPH2)
MNDPLFEPISIGNVECKNRIYVPAMHLNMIQGFEINERIVDFYVERARGGAGMISAGFAAVDELSGGPFNIGAHDDKFLPGLKRLAAGIRDNGAKAVLQLNHAGRYNISLFTGGKTPVAPSPIASRLTRETPRELEESEIIEIVEHFAQAADRVRRAGFDAVEILSGTGYLISEFLSPLTNKREDAWGGSLENRMRFGLDVAKAVRKAVGPDFPIIFRVNGSELMQGGSTREDLKAYAARVAQEGVDALCVNVGWHEARVPQIVTEVPRGAFAYLARGIKEQVGVPVIASHRINDPAVARNLISDGFCDMVAVGRAVIADPEFPNKAREGREGEIVHCIGCAQGCFDHLFQMQPVACLCNPRAGLEKETVIEKAEAPQKVLVVGGGPAGMSAAVAAMDRGHEVVLYEKDKELGGQLLLAGAMPGRREFIQLARDLAKQLSVRGIRAELGREADEKLIDKEKPDVVVLATGARPVAPGIPGEGLPHVVQAWDVLGGRVSTGRKVAVVGGGAVGVETALYLARQGTLSGEVLKFLLVQRAESVETLYDLAIRGSKEVVLIEMKKSLGEDIGKSTRWGLIKDLEIASVKARTLTEVVEITKGGVNVKRGDAVEEISFDTVVLALGSKPYNPLEALLKQKGIACTLIGDAKSVAKAYDAIHQGFQTGRNI